MDWRTGKIDKESVEGVIHGEVSRQKNNHIQREGDSFNIYSTWMEVWQEGYAKVAQF